MEQQLITYSYCMIRSGSGCRAKRQADRPINNAEPVGEEEYRQRDDG